MVLDWVQVELLVVLDCVHVELVVVLDWVHREGERMGLVGDLPGQRRSRHDTLLILVPRGSGLGAC